jgi:hypothetical protein
MPAYEYRTSGVPLAYSASTYRASLSYKPYVRMRTKCLSMLKIFLSRRASPYASVYHRMRPCSKHMSAYTSVRVIFFIRWHTLAVFHKCMVNNVVTINSYNIRFSSKWCSLVTICWEWCLFSAS